MSAGRTGDPASTFAPRVRAAVAADLDDLVRLHDLARAHVGAERGGEIYLGREARPLPVDSTLRDDLGAPGRLVVVGTLGEVAVGFAVALLEELHDTSRIAQVSELFVEPEARDIGVGAALMDSLLEWATEQGCVGIGSVVLPGDRSSKNFFESFGLVARAIVVHRDLRES